MPRFPKPSFDALVANYEVDPESVHDCPFLYKKNPISLNTCAIRMGEALALANNLVESRADITALNAAASGGASRLLGKYRYAASLCPHGISRGARDLADFLRSQWGSPSLSWTAQDDEKSVPEDALGERGVMAFIKLPDFAGQGHIDLWNGDDAVGHAYWNAQKIYLWRVD